MPRVTRRLALGAILVLAALPMAAPVAAKDPAKAEHDRIVAYWTPARMASAMPRDFVKAGGKVVAERQSRQPPRWRRWRGDRRIVDQPGQPDRGPLGEGLLHDGHDPLRLFGVGGRRLARRITRWCSPRGIAPTTRSPRSSPRNGCSSPPTTPPRRRRAPRRRTDAGRQQALVVHNGFATAGGFNTQAMVHDFAFAVVGGGHGAKRGRTRSWTWPSAPIRCASERELRKQALRVRLSGRRQVQGQGPRVLRGQHLRRPVRQQPDVGHDLQHDRRFVGRPVAVELRRFGPRVELAELVRPPGSSEHVRAEVQRQHRRPSTTRRTAPRRTTSSATRPSANLASAQFGRAAQQERVAIRVGLGCSMTLVQP